MYIFLILEILATSMIASKAGPYIGLDRQLLWVRSPTSGTQYFVSKTFTLSILIQDRKKERKVSKKNNF